MNTESTIAAIATPSGMGAIAVIRLSGSNAVSICEGIFKPAKQGKQLAGQPANTIHYGSIMDGSREVDQVLVSLFRSPHSYTGEDVVEISCHGSPLVQQQVLETLIKHGATFAQPGEFTLRAFLNGKLDLSQAEGVADLIASSSEAARRLALNQIRGGFSSVLMELREQLLNFISLIELELDFSEEEVEFADRSQLTKLIGEMDSHIEQLMESFTLGNVIKNGVPVAIVGEPNVGKSTLLNQLLREERAIVSDIPGTTRDTIEDTISINGISFRFVDTAGIRHTTDSIEKLGIERTYSAIYQAHIVMLMVDVKGDIQECIGKIEAVRAKIEEHQHLIILINKTDTTDSSYLEGIQTELTSRFGIGNVIAIAAKAGVNIDKLTDRLVGIIGVSQHTDSDVVVTNARHYHALTHAHESLKRVTRGLSSNTPSDLIAMDIRQVLHYIGEITGEITTDEVLGNIFSRFCIGK